MQALTIDLLNEESATKDVAENRDFIPTCPVHETQAARLLVAVLLGKKVTPVWGLIRLGIYRPSDTIFRPKEMGWPIEADRLDVPNKFGETCHVALYSLPNWAIDAAGEEGRVFAEHEFRLMDEQKAA